MITEFVNLRLVETFQNRSRNFFNRWTVDKILLTILAIVSLVFGLRIAYPSYVQRNILEKCATGLSCPYQLDGLQIQSTLGTVRIQLDFGAGLAVLGIIILVDVFFVMDRRSHSRQKSVKDSSEEDSDFSSI